MKLLPDIVKANYSAKTPFSSIEFSQPNAVQACSQDLIGTEKNELT